MPTENWYPISGATHDLPTSHDDFANNGGANKNASVRVGGGRAGPATHDEGTTYLSRLNTGNQAVNIDWPGPMLSYDGTITAAWRDATSGVSVNRLGAMINAGGTVGTAWVNVSDASGAYVDHSADISNAATYRPGGGSWGTADFADDKTMFARVINAGGAGTVFVTSIWGTIAYTPTAGGFVFLLGLAGLSALPLVGTLADIAQFRRFLSWRRRHHPRHTILTGDEVVKAWRELRAHPFRVYSFA